MTPPLASHRFVPLLAIALATALHPVPAQQPRALTTADYARAERMTGRGGTNVGGTVTPNWLADDRMWYRDSSATGVQFILVDPVKKTRLPAFDHAAVAAALSKASGASYDAAHLPFAFIVFSADGKQFSANAGGKGYSCQVRGSGCRALPAPVPAPTSMPDGGVLGGRGRGGGGGGRGGGATMSSDGKPLTMSPDGKRGVFIRDWNLWLHDNGTGRETQLTTDGVKDFGYATENAGWTRSNGAYGVWSPDGKKFATNQQDERGVGEMYVVTTPLAGGHPTLISWKYPYVGDSIITTIQRVIVDVDNHQVIRLKAPAEAHRSTRADNIQTTDLIWNPDGTQLAIASTTRDHKMGIVRVANAQSGDVRPVFDETAKTQFEMWVVWHVLWPSNEAVWYSQRDNYGHLYLYDLTTGNLKNQIVTGDVIVKSIDFIDEKNRVLWFTGEGGVPGENPYYTHFYRVNLDGTHQVDLTPEMGNHDAGRLSPDRKYLVDTWSQSDIPPTTALRDATDGHLIVPLEKGDRAQLLATGWHPITTIKMKGRDGKADIYGLMYTPTNLDSNRKYPIINHNYPGPQQGSVTGSWGFRAGGGEPQGLAELGFIVVEINGMGTPDRTKSFMDTWFGHLSDNTIPDQVTGMKQLAQQYKFIDIDKVGIYGHSGGGFATGSAMFRYPDFFKVGISESGTFDEKDYEDDWGERHIGLVKKNPDGTDNFTNEATYREAGNLKGHLLLIHGTDDQNVPPQRTLRVVDALIKANKDFDLLMLPNQGHGYQGEFAIYAQRRRWDYFVRYLMGAEPPKEYPLGGGGGRGGGAGGRGGRGGGGGGGGN